MFLNAVTNIYRYNIISVCVVDVRTVVENYEVDENDKIYHVDRQQQETTSLSDITPSHYLKHQGIIYAT